MVTIRSVPISRKRTVGGAGEGGAEGEGGGDEAGLGLGRLCMHSCRLLVRRSNSMPYAVGAGRLMARVPPSASLIPGAVMARMCLPCNLVLPETSIANGLDSVPDL